jgi:prepilin-type N-terminal cleavage/methylation domain-containing protein
LEAELMFRKQLSRGAGERGVTLIELLISMVVFAFIAAGVATGLGGGLSLVRNNRNRSVAAHLVSREMDTLRALPDPLTSLPPGTVTSTATVPAAGGTDYTITRTVSRVFVNDAVDACQGASGSNLAYLRVVVTVTWPNMNSIPAVRSETILNALDPTKGNIAVRVVNAAGAPLSGKTVTLVSTDPVTNKSEVTTAEGCAFFPRLEPGTYTASLNTTGYVTSSTPAAQLATKDLAVAAAQTTAYQFDYDLAVTYQLNIADATYPRPTQLTTPFWTVQNTGLVPNGTYTYSPAASPKTITPLFPYTGGYTVRPGNTISPATNAQTCNPYTTSPVTASPPGLFLMPSAPGTNYVSNMYEQFDVNTTIISATSNYTTNRPTRVLAKNMASTCPNSSGSAANGFTVVSSNFNTRNTATGNVTTTTRFALYYGVWQVRVERCDTSTSAPDCFDDDGPTTITSTNIVVTPPPVVGDPVGPPNIVTANF